MDNEQFSTHFCVRANSSQEAYYILTPHMMECITVMVDKSDGVVYTSFLWSGKLHVAIQTGRDFFRFGESNVGMGELRQKSPGELRQLTDVVDTLRVEGTLCKKEIDI